MVRIKERVMAEREFWHKVLEQAFPEERKDAVADFDALAGDIATVRKSMERLQELMRRDLRRTSIDAETDWPVRPGVRRTVN
jgi:hypothetical protein